jgi:V8-like Glu-specific endopeptidase
MAKHGAIGTNAKCYAVLVERSAIPHLVLTVLIGFASIEAAAQSALPRKDIPAIARAANGAIVTIVMSDKDGRAIAQGTGFLISKDGRIVTNYHVIEEGAAAVVKFPEGAFYIVDGVVASDKARDLAIIKAHGQNFRPLTLGNSDRVQVGEEVVAIGNPLSLESTVSNGIISGIRTVEERGGQFLQTTAPISPGSSGGPLFNMAGEVIGINTLYLEGGENLNFAIPVNDAKRLLSNQSATLQALPNEPDLDTSKVSGPSLQDTLDWMVDFSNLHGGDNGPHPGYRHWSLLREERGCAVRIGHIDTSAQPSSAGDVDTLNLRDINPHTIMVTDSTTVNLFTIDSAPSIHRIITLSDGETRKFELSSDYLSFDSKENADRFATALRHAVMSCGRVKEPF